MKVNNTYCRTKVNPSWSTFILGKLGDRTDAAAISEGGQRWPEINYSKTTFSGTFTETSCKQLIEYKCYSSALLILMFINYKHSLLLNHILTNYLYQSYKI